MSSVLETYADEAQKRLQPDGELRFQDIQTSESPRICHTFHDAWADPGRPNMRPDSRTKFMIVGAGMGGIVSAVRLILAGFHADQIHIVDAAGGVGGTWYWNRYPGVHCDIESYVYMPLLEEMGYMPSQKYASEVKIRRYLQVVMEKYQLNDRIIFGTRVDRLQWSEQGRVWKAELSPAQKPGSTIDEPPADNWTVPKLDGTGAAGFKGDMFHTAAGDYSVTGDSSEQAFTYMDRLSDKRVGIIGTGATAVQVVPCLAKHAKEVFVFQRTPSAVYSCGQRDTDATEWRDVIASREGWHSERMESMLTASLDLAIKK